MHREKNQPSPVSVRSFTSPCGAFHLFCNASSDTWNTLQFFWLLSGSKCGSKVKFDAVDVPENENKKIQYEGQNPWQCPCMPKT
jgi:hypothetical protein